MVQEVYSKDGAAGVSTHFRKFGIKANIIREQARLLFLVHTIEFNFLGKSPAPVFFIAASLRCV